MHYLGDKGKNLFSMSYDIARRCLFVKKKTSLDAKGRGLKNKRFNTRCNGQIAFHFQAICLSMKRLAISKNLRYKFYL